LKHRIGEGVENIRLRTPLLNTMAVCHGEMQLAYYDLMPRDFAQITLFNFMANRLS